MTPRLLTGRHRARALVTAEADTRVAVICRSLLTPGMVERRRRVTHHPARMIPEPSG
jgi:hypothetical protein